MMTITVAIAQWKQAPFARGSTDCCAFVDHCLKMTTGKSYLPAYNTDEGAEAIVRRFGSLERAVTHYLRKAPVAPDKLQSGDVALVRVLDIETIGMLMENGNVAVIFENAGLREISDGFIDGGWAIGH